MEEMQKLIKIAEKLGWNISWKAHGLSEKDAEYYAELEQCSPAGEDFFFSISYKDAAGFAREVREFYNEFDPDEHIEELIVAKHNGLRDVPRVSVLLNDSEAIDAMLLELTDALSDAYSHMEEDENNE